MAKKTIQLPDHFAFSIDYQVVYSDLNVANHLAADRIQAIAIEAQFCFMKALGLDRALAPQTDGMITAYAEVAYLCESGHGDVLRVDVTANVTGDKSVDFIYRLFNTTRQQEAARVINTNLFFHYPEQRVISVPDYFHRALADFSANSL